MAQAINRNFPGFDVSYNIEWELLSFTADGASKQVANCNLEELKKLSGFLIKVINKADELHEHPMGQS